MFRWPVGPAAVVVCLCSMAARPSFAQADAGTHTRHAASHSREKRQKPVGLPEVVARLIGEPEVVRAHWGVDVAAMDGTPLFGLNEGHFFQPASNAKLFTTAAAMALLGAESTVETRIVGRGALVHGGATLRGDLVLVGAGDATISGEDLPYVAPPPREQLPPGAAPPPGPDPLRYLAAMADRVAASGLKVVEGDVIGDDTVWPYEPYPEDWAADDLLWGYGAPVSALAVADNQVRLTVTPAAVAGQPAAVTLEEAVPFYTVEAGVMTTAARSTVGGVQVERAPGSKVLRVYGVIAVDAAADVEEVAIDDPAAYAAAALKQMLAARGVQVRGQARALHVLSTEPRGFAAITRAPLMSRAGRDVAVGKRRAGVTEAPVPAGLEQRTLASRISLPLGEDVVLTNKVSQNLHAELLQRRLGAASGDAGTAAQGARVLRSFLVQAGVDPDDFVFYDGSGLSGHDLVTPRAAVRLLVYASGQPWFPAWRASLPVGGVDGSLQTRFGAKSRLNGKVFAKTGTLGEARALSGYMVCASGRTVAFSVMVTDHAPGGSKDREVMDRVVEAIAAAE